MPHVTKQGHLSEPYPIKTRGDVNRARVLPPPLSTAPPSRKEEQRAPVQRDLSQPKGGFDYVRKRNAVLREVSGRRK